jgi:hypothetical protein
MCVGRCRAVQLGRRDPPLIDGFYGARPRICCLLAAHRWLASEPLDWTALGRTSKTATSPSVIATMPAAVQPPRSHFVDVRAQSAASSPAARTLPGVTPEHPITRVRSRSSAASSHGTSNCMAPPTSPSTARPRSRRTASSGWSSSGHGASSSHPTTRHDRAPFVRPRRNALARPSSASPCWDRS